MSAVRRRALRESFTHRGFRPECRGYRCVVEVAMQRSGSSGNLRNPGGDLRRSFRSTRAIRTSCAPKAIQERYVPPRRRAA